MADYQILSFHPIEPGKLTAYIRYKGEKRPVPIMGWFSLGEMDILSEVPIVRTVVPGVWDEADKSVRPMTADPTLWTLIIGGVGDDE